MNIGQPFVNQFSDQNDVDVIGYFGEVMRGEDSYLIREAKKRRKRKNVMLALCTRGGDPNAAYRISRALQLAYQTANRRQPGNNSLSAPKIGTFSVLIDGSCKSAGTLICLGADRLVMSDDAELGPIDAQVRKQDEVGEMTSGLTPMQAMQFLESHSTILFKKHFRSLRDQNELGFSTKVAAEVATNTVVGLLTPIYQQIDPMRLAELDRFLRIAKEYGDRLKTENVKDETIDQLLVKYPSHGFAIDRTEARNLFAKVDEPTADEEKLSQAFSVFARYYLNREEAFAYYISDEPTPPAPPPAPPTAAAPAAPAATDQAKSEPDNTADAAPKRTGQASPSTGSGPGSLAPAAAPKSARGKGRNRAPS